MPELVSQQRDDVLVARFSSEKIFADAAIQQTGDELVNLVDQSDGKLLLDFEPVKFMSSLMIGKIIILRKKCKASAVTIKLCNICPSVMGVFEVTRLDRLFKMYDTVEDALNAFSD
ncbi:MAG: STAS domain-containing protein [Pirellulaceae bacterium]|nr:STAS domain-containing protein [Pirellulaceae bacterium]